MPEIELKPCPFCGGKAEIYQENGTVSIGCSQCQCGTAYMSGASTTEKKIEIATRDWNRRADNDR